MLFITRYSLKFLWIMLLFCAVNNLVKAQNSASFLPDSMPIYQDTPRLQALDAVVITAFRLEKPRFLTAEAISVLEKQHFQAFQPRTTPEALQNTVGVFVQKTNHGGGSPIIRGLTGNQTLILVDGIRLNNATFRYGPNQYLNTVDPLSIERVEVLRGGGSTQFGSDAMGGTVQILTKNALFSDKKSVNGAILGKFTNQKMEQTGRAELSFSSKKMAAIGGFSYRNFGDLFGGDTTGKQSPTGYREQNFDVKMQFKASEKQVWTIAHQNVKQVDVPIFHKIQLENFKINAFEPQARQLTYAKIEHDFKGEIFKKAFLTASFQQTQEGRRSQKNGSTTLRIENDSVSTIGFSSGFSTFFSENWSANSGFDVYSDRVLSHRVDETNGIAAQKRGLYPNDARMTSFALYSLHQIQKDDWQVTFGGRWNGYNIEVADENGGKTLLKPAAVVGNVGILRGLKNPNFAVFAAFNSAFRAPNVDDLGSLGVVDFRYEIPNYGLKPEKSYNFQVGLKVKTEKTHFEMYLFRNHLRDLITRIRKDGEKINGYDVYEKRNTESAYIQGTEIEFKHQILRGVNIEGFMTYTFGQNKTLNEPMRRIPPLNGRFALNFMQKRTFLTLETLAATAQTRLAAGDKADNRIPMGGTPSWVIANIFGGISLKHLKIQGTFHNIFSQDYRLHGSGVNGMGRAMSVSINVML
jgi:hemoglobin/transferrin/lactoferrin receptor protein